MSLREISKEPFQSDEERVADVLLELGALLHASGAHCGRVTRNLERVALQWGYRMELFLTFSGLMISLFPENKRAARVSRFKRSPAPTLHFGIVTEISLLSWRVVEENLPVEAVEKELERIKRTPHYPRWVALSGIGAACACLCLLLGGDLWDAGFTFTASICGLFVRQQVVEYRFNPMIGVMAAAFVTTSIAGLDLIAGWGHSPEKALAAAVLYLIPGVPLINCVIDLMEGNILPAVARGVFGGFVLLCLAVGMTLGIALWGVQHF
ncbi:MAG: threonine/serine exporter family protein [Luteolibacter sp.]